MNTYSYCFDLVQQLVPKMVHIMSSDIKNEFIFFYNKKRYKCVIDGRYESVKAQIMEIDSTEDYNKRTLMQVRMTPFHGKCDTLNSGCNSKETEEDVSYTLLNQGTVENITYAFKMGADSLMQFNPENIESELFMSSTIQVVPELSDCISVFENTPHLLGLCPTGFLLHSMVSKNKIVNQDFIDMFIHLVLKGIEQWSTVYEFE